MRQALNNLQVSHIFTVMHQHVAVLCWKQHHASRHAQMYNAVLMIKLLQSTFGGYGLINQENVFKVCDQPHPLLVGSIIGNCLKLKIDEAYDGMRVIPLLPLCHTKPTAACDVVTAPSIFVICLTFIRLICIYEEQPMSISFKQSQSVTKAAADERISDCSVSGFPQ